MMHAVMDPVELLGRIIGLFLVPAFIAAFVVGVWAMVGRPCNKAQIKATYFTALCFVVISQIVVAGYEANRAAHAPVKRINPEDTPEGDAKIRAMFEDVAKARTNQAEK